ncbi:MAG: response regulator, partial [Phycisphaerales bacterium]|nr:response regulator [Phycisphaerales bacterium]
MGSSPSSEGAGRDGRARPGAGWPAEVATQTTPGAAAPEGVDRAGVEVVDRLAALGTLAAGLGHDMNNVLLPVRAHLNALRAGDGEHPLPDSARHHIDAVSTSIAYLQQLADGLHFLAMDSEQETARGESVELGAWWAHVGPLVLKAVPKQVQVTAAIPAGVLRVRMGAAGLTQSILNLLVNAGESIPPERAGRVHLWAEADAPNGGVRIGVTDDGCGMSEAVRRRAFDMFFTTKPRGMGTGLGLPLVRRVIERVGGSVQVDSAPGKGTTVVLHVPAARTSPDRDSGGSKRPAAGPRARRKSSRTVEPRERIVRVLCIDDHAILIEGLKAQFAIDGEVACVGHLSSAAGLLEEVERLLPDVVLLDIEMPGPDVFEMADRLHHLHADVRFVLLSAHVKDRYVEAAEQSGAWGYFSKGDDLGELVAGIKEVAHSDRNVFVMGAKVRQHCPPAAQRAVAHGHVIRDRNGGMPRTGLASLTPREL